MLNKMDGIDESKKREAELEKIAKEEERKRATEEANDSECAFTAILDMMNKKTMAEHEARKEKLSENDGVMERARKSDYVHWREHSVTSRMDSFFTAFGDVISTPCMMK